LGVEWRELSGHEGYEISNTGLVRSWVYPTRWGTRTRKVPKLLNLSSGHDGYLRVKLGRGLGTTIRVHIKVLEQFVGPRPDGMEACHANDIKTDNTLANLRWASPSNNREDARKNGKLCVGSSHPLSKLTEATVQEARSMQKNGKSYQELARHFGVCAQTMKDACNGKTWRHV